MSLPFLLSNSDESEKKGSISSDTWKEVKKLIPNGVTLQRNVNFLYAKLLFFSISIIENKYFYTCRGGGVSVSIKYVMLILFSAEFAIK